MNILEKWEHLKELLREMECVLIAYSGGVDSSLLLKAAADTLGPNVIAVTGDSETYPAGELSEAKEFARSLGVTHQILHTGELSTEEFVANSSDRCYFCKKELYGRLRQIADREGISSILDGSNVDDLKDYRPGSKAAAEFGVRSPLQEAGFSKKEVRECARTLNLPGLGQIVARLSFLPHSLRYQDHSRNIEDYSVCGRPFAGSWIEAGARTASRQYRPDRDRTERL